MSGYWGQNTQSPSKEELLREEYPDLKEKWEVYHDLGRNFLEADKELKKFGIIKRFLNSEKYSGALANLDETKNLYEDALREYLTLEKLLWDY